MLFQVLKYDVLCYGTVGGRKVAPAPKMASPVAFFEMREFALHFVGRPSLHQAHQVAYGQFRRHRYEHVDVVAGQDAPQDIDAILAANLPDDVAHTQPDIALKHFVTVFGRPDEVIAVIENAMLPGS